MADRIFKQPNGLYGVFSTVTDQIVLVDATEAELTECLEMRIAARARGEAERAVRRITSGMMLPMSLAEALEQHCPENCGSADWNAMVERMKAGLGAR